MCKPPIPEGPDWQRQKRLQESTKHRKSVKSLGNIFHPEENPPKTTAEKIKLGLVNDPKKRGRKPKIPPTPEMESMTEEDPEGKNAVKEQFSLKNMRDDTDELLNKYLEQKGKVNQLESKHVVAMD